MKTIPLAKAIDLLAAATAVYVDDESVALPHLLDRAEEDGLFLRFYTGGGGNEEFADESNEVVTVDEDGQLVLVNTGGYRTKIMPLVAKPVKV